jgi:hypothetical protein
VTSSLPGSTKTPAAEASSPDRTTAGRRVLIEEELVDSVAWLIRLRWVASLGVILATWFVSFIFPLEVPRLPLTVIGVGIFLYNLVFYLTERRFEKTTSLVGSYRKLAFGQVGLDWLAMILLIHFSGGIESPAIFFFIFHIIIASIFFPPVIAYTFALSAIVLLSLTAVLEFNSILPHYAITGLLHTPLYQNGLYVITTLVFFGGTGLIAAYLATSIQERLRQHEAGIIDLSESLQKAANRLQALNDSARNISSTLDLQRVLDRLVQTTSEVMGVRACSIRLLTKSGERLDTVAVYGLSQTYLEKGLIEVENNPLAREVLAGKVVNIPDVTVTSLLQYSDWAVQEGIFSTLSAPMPLNETGLQPKTRLS